MEIIAKYRPLSSVISIISEFDEHVPDEMRDRYVKTDYLDGDEETGQVSVTFLRKSKKSYVLGAMCLDVLDKGKNWSMWLSPYFTDDFLSTLHEMVAQWDAEWQEEKSKTEYAFSTGDLITKVYQVVLTVPNETLVMEDTK
jgi:hypothetical protein